MNSSSGSTHRVPAGLKHHGTVLSIFLLSSSGSLDPRRRQPPVRPSGEGQSEHTYLLSSASFAGRFEDGTVLISDGREGRIHRFTRDGSWVGAFGRMGPGPTEFGTGFTPYIVEDHIQVWVGSNFRMLLFDSEGNYMDGRRSSVPIGSPPIPVTADRADGYFTVYRMVTSPMPDTGVATARFVVLEVNPDFTETDTLIYHQHDVQGFWAGTMYSYQPYQVLVPPYAIATGLPLAIADMFQYRIDIIPVRGRDTVAVEIPVKRVPITAEDRQRRIGDFARYGLEEAARRYMRFPDHRPAI